MGNKFSFRFVYLLFSIFIFSSMDVYAQKTCPPGKDLVDGECVTSIEGVTITAQSAESICLSQQGAWNATTKTCVGALSCAKFKNGNCMDAAAVHSAQESCTKGGGIFNSTLGTCDNRAKECEASGGVWGPSEVNVVAFGGVNFECTYEKKPQAGSCDASNSRLGQPADHNGDTNHCECLYQSTGQPTEYVIGEPNNCLKEDPAKSLPPTATVTDEVYQCIADIQQKIQECASSVNDGQLACSEQSAQNQKYTGPASTLANTLAASMHSKGAAAGAAQQCRNAAMVSTSSQYAINAVASSCNKALQACKNSCAGIADVYSDPQAIMNHCQDANVDQAALARQAQQLSQELAEANNSCSGTSSSLAKQFSNLTNYAGQLGSAFAQAAACDCALTNSCPTDCVSNPSSAACRASYTDCAQNPTAPACKCVINPYDSSCKSAVSQLAGASGKTGSAYGSSGYAATSISKGSDASGGGSWDLGDGADPSNYIGGNATADASSLDYKRASPASAAGGGGGGGASGADGEEGLMEEPESKGLAGVFKNITNGVKSMLGLGGAKTSGSGLNKTASEKKLVEEKKKYRGLATADKFCVVGQNGQELCFGRKNMNIFQMINRGYSKQSDTFLEKK